MNEGVDHWQHQIHVKPLDYNKHYVAVLGFPRETEPIGCVYVCVCVHTHIYEEIIRSWFK